MTPRSFADLSAHEIFLNPGELACGAGNQVFGTLLGSCVAITLWHPRTRTGCMCHYVLPTDPDPSNRSDGRYADSAFAQMVEELQRRKVPLHECEAKLFGGGMMFNESGVHNVGARNIAMARRLLDHAHVPVVAENTGQGGYRRLYFDVRSGEVWVKFDWLDSDQEDVIL